jgi:hypothetical protein
MPHELLSPEANIFYNKAIDIHNIGLVLAELLTGKVGSSSLSPYLTTGHYHKADFSSTHIPCLGRVPHPECPKSITTLLEKMLLQNHNERPMAVRLVDILTNIEDRNKSQRT